MSFVRNQFFPLSQYLLIYQLRHEPRRECSCGPNVLLSTMIIIVSLNQLTYCLVGFRNLILRSRRELEVRHKDFTQSLNSQWIAPTVHLKTLHRRAHTWDFTRFQELQCKSLNPSSRTLQSVRNLWIFSRTDTKTTTFCYWFLLCLSLPTSVSLRPSITLFGNKLLL